MKSGRINGWNVRGGRLSLPVLWRAFLSSGTDWNCRILRRLASSFFENKKRRPLVRRVELSMHRGATKIARRGCSGKELGFSFSSNKGSQSHRFSSATSGRIDYTTDVVIRACTRTNY